MSGEFSDLDSDLCTPDLSNNANLVIHPANSLTGSRMAATRQKKKQRRHNTDVRCLDKTIMNSHHEMHASV